MRARLLAVAGDLDAAGLAAAADQDLRLDDAGVADLVRRGDGVADGDDPIPGVRDFDGDGLDDGIEVALGSDPRNADTDGDALPDGLRTAGLEPEVLDPDVLEPDVPEVDDEPAVEPPLPEDALASSPVAASKYVAKPPPPRPV